MPETKTRLRKEDLFIRYCCRTDITTGDYAARIKDLLNTPLEWDYCFARANNERVAPLLYKALTRIEGADSAVPSRIWQTLKERYYTVLGKNAALVEQMEDLSVLFRSHGIGFLLFKGLALAEAVYQNVGLRESSDFDLLIHKNDFPDIDALLKNLGYEPFFDTGNVALLPCNPYRNSVMYHSRDHLGIPLHIYWHPINLVSYHAEIMSALDLEKVFLESQIIPIGAAQVATYSPHHQILFLSMHALSHGFSPLVLLCDINELIRAEGNALDWNKTVDDAFSFRLSKHVFYTLYLCERILETKMPGWVMAALRQKKLSFFERRVLESVEEGAGAAGQEWLMYLFMNERLAEKASFLKRALFPSARELSLIKQKDCAKINALDYIARFFSAILCGLRVVAKQIVRGKKTNREEIPKKPL